MAMLTLRRPQYGIRVDSERTSWAPPDDHARMVALKVMGRRLDSSPIDTLFAVTRQLLTYDAQFECSSAQEKALLEAAWLDMGWEQYPDHQIKYRFLQQLLGIEVVAVDSLDGLTFDNLIRRPDLSKIVLENEEFQLFYRHAPSRRDDDEKAPLEIKEIPLQLFRQISELEPWDGTCPLGDYIVGRVPRHTLSHESKVYFPYIARPTFLYVPYTSNGSGPNFATMRSFRLNAETIWQEEQEWVRGSPSTLYVICAIVRLAGDGRSDDVRLYWKQGGEIVPTNTDVEKAAMKEFNELNRRWSVEGPGRFMLFYVRVDDDGNEAEIRKDAAEFGPRDWEKLTVQQPSAPSNERPQSSQDSPKAATKTAPSTGQSKPLAPASDGPIWQPRKEPVGQQSTPRFGSQDSQVIQPKKRGKRGREGEVPSFQTAPERQQQGGWRDRGSQSGAPSGQQRRPTAYAGQSPSMNVSSQPNRQSDNRQTLQSLGIGRAAGDPSFAGVAKRAASLTLPEDELAEHWKRVDERIREEKKKNGAFDSGIITRTQATIAQRMPNLESRVAKMDANLLKVNPVVNGEYTYIVKLQAVKDIKDAAFGEPDSLFAIQDKLGVQVRFMTSPFPRFNIHVEPYRGDEDLYDKPDAVKQKLVRGHGLLKFWVWRIGADRQSNKKLTTLKEACDIWLNKESPAVGDYFKHLRQPDDRFGAPKPPVSTPEAKPKADHPEAEQNGPPRVLRHKFFTPGGEELEVEFDLSTEEGREEAEKVWDGNWQYKPPKKTFAAQTAKAESSTANVVTEKAADVPTGNSFAVLAADMPDVESSEDDTAPQKLNEDTTKARSSTETGPPETTKPTQATVEEETVSGPSNKGGEKKIAWPTPEEAKSFIEQRPKQPMSGGVVLKKKNN